MSKSCLSCLDTFTRQYLITALWSSTDNSRDDGGDPLDQNYDLSDIAEASLVKAQADCAKFQADNAADIATWTGKGPAAEQAGHDFWLTRNGHGCGFWDGDWDKAVGERLTAASKAYGECYAVVGDDGQIHLEGGR